MTVPHRHAAARGRRSVTLPSAPSAPRGLRVSASRRTRPRGAVRRRRPGVRRAHRRRARRAAAAARPRLGLPQPRHARAARRSCATSTPATAPACTRSPAASERGLRRRASAAARCARSTRQALASACAAALARRTGCERAASSHFPIVGACRDCTATPESAPCTSLTASFAPRSRPARASPRPARSATALRRASATLDERRVPLLGVTAAFVFAAQMLNFPVAGGTSGHFLGAALAAVLLGPWLACLVLSVVLSSRPSCSPTAASPRSARTCSTWACSARWSSAG